MPDHGDAPGAAAPAPAPAATVIVLRDSATTPEVFLVRRHEGTAFFSGAHVFPGGRVDAADRDASAPAWCDGVEHAVRQLPGIGAAAAVAYHLAAARELFEEAGVLLARTRSGQFIAPEGADLGRYAQHRDDVHAGRAGLGAIAGREGLRIALDALVLFAHWVTPPGDTRRFDTRFFAARVPPAQMPSHDEKETTHGVWATASGALEAARRGEIVLPPPTWTTLRELERFRSVADVLAWAATRAVGRREPALRSENGHRVLLMPGDSSNPDRDGEPVASETRFVWEDGRWQPVG
jgi:8-oxo-dGTP pyrophosphatase MutT (NUDIX family)